MWMFLLIIEILTRLNYYLVQKSYQPSIEVINFAKRGEEPPANTSITNFPIVS